MNLSLTKRRKPNESITQINQDLYVDGKTLYVVRSLVIIRKFTFEHEILDATWCQMSQSNDPTLAVLTREFIHLYHPLQDHILPNTVFTKVYRIDGGLVFTNAQGRVHLLSEPFGLIENTGDDLVEIVDGGYSTWKEGKLRVYKSVSSSKRLTFDLEIDKPKKMRVARSKGAKVYLIQVEDLLKVYDESKAMISQYRVINWECVSGREDYVILQQTDGVSIIFNDIKIPVFFDEQLKQGCKRTFSNMEVEDSIQLAITGFERCKDKLGVVTEDEVFDCVIQLQPKNELVDKCLRGLKYALPADCFNAFSVGYFCYGSLNSEWTTFAVVLLSYLAPDHTFTESKLDDWTWMQNSHQNLKSFNLHKDKSDTVKILYQKSRKFKSNSSECSIPNYTKEVLVTLFYVYEDLRLNLGLKRFSNQLGLLLRFLCYVNGYQMSVYFEADGVGCDFGREWVKSNNTVLPRRVLAWLYQKIKGVRTRKLLEELEHIGPGDLDKLTNLELLKKVSRVYDMIFEEQRPSIDVVRHLIHLEDFSIDLLPHAVALPLRQALFECRDLADQLGANLKACELLCRRDLAALLHGMQIDSKQRLSVLDERQEIIKHLFLKDDRIQIVRELLHPTVEPTLSINIATDMSVEDIQQEQQKALTKHSFRYFALSLGQGMFDFESSVIVPTEVFPIATNNCSAKLPPLNASVSLNTTSNPEIMDWPDFHLGVAAGLQIKPDCKDVTSSWIVFNQIKNDQGRVMDASHGGFILGLGLNAHLRKLESVDSLRNYFMPQFEIVTIGHLLGLSFAYLGTKNKNVSNMLIVHLPLMLPSQAVDLFPGFLLKSAAIVGLGLVNYQSVSPRTFDKILKYLQKEQSMDNSVERNGTDTFLIACGMSLGLMGLGAIRKECTVSREIVAPLITLLNSPGLMTTKIGVSIALGLLGLKSNDVTILKGLEIPTSEFELDRVTPEYLLVRTIARMLVMWDHILPTREWIEEKVPIKLREMIKRAGTVTAKNSHIFHCYYSVIAGCCFGIGLKYAGTFNKKAYKILSYTLSEFKGFISKKNSDGTFFKRQSTLIWNRLICCIASAISIVMAGSANRTAFNAIKSSYDLIRDPDYGIHTAFSSSLGLLFLGGGTCTLGRSELAIASLFISFFPMYPGSVNDNRYHLQALRHMWALAVERRLLVTRNVDDGSIDCVPFQVILNEIGPDGSNKVLKLVSPAMLPSYDEILSLRISNPRYWPITISVDKLKNMKTDSFHLIFVQRRTQFLSYLQDPDGQRGILATSIPKLKEGVSQNQLVKVRDQFIQSFSTSPQLLSFVRYLCNPLDPAKASIEDKLSNFSTVILYHCLSQDKNEMVQVYLWIYNTLEQTTTTGIPDANTITLLKMIFQFGAHMKSKDYGFNSIVDLPFLDLAEHHLRDYFAGIEQCVYVNPSHRLNRPIFDYLKGWSENQSLGTDQGVEQARVIYAYMAFKEWPDLQQSRQIIECLTVRWLSLKVHKDVLLILMKRQFPTIPIGTLSLVLEVFKLI